MNSPVEALPAVLPIPVVELAPDQRPRCAGPKCSWRYQGYLPWTVGWAWRLAVGVCLCLNYFPLSYVTSVLVFGWLYRWMQTTVLRGWWRQSKLRDEVPFHAFCDSLKEEAPSPRPAWFSHEHPARLLNAPGPDGKPAGLFRTLGRFAVIPVHSLWLNARLGVQGLLATYLLMAWPCALILFSWHFGWHNSFYKGYEDYWVGPTLGLLGMFGLVVALVYVPMAQAHQAVAGRVAAFFQVGVVWRLIKARLTAYAGLALLFVLLSLVLEVVHCFVLSDDFAGNLDTLTPAEGLDALRAYLFRWTIFFFLSLFALRGLTAIIYRSAVLKALRTGTIEPRELPPPLAGWLRRLDLVPPPTEPRTDVVVLAKSVA